MKKLYYFFVASIFISAVLIFDQIWFGFLSKSVFLKILSTIGVCNLFVALSFFLRQELIKNKKLKDDGYID